MLKVLSSFPPASTDAITKICIPLLINNVTDLDPIPSFLLKQVSVSIHPIITTIVNISLSTGTFLIHIKQSLVTPLLKKPPLDKSTLNHYRSTSNLSLISKITEHIVKSHLNTDLSSTPCTTLINLPIPNITLLKLLFCLT